MRGKRTNLTFKINENKRTLKKSIFGTTDCTSSLKNQTAGNFVTFIFYLNVNFRTMNSF